MSVEEGVLESEITEPIEQEHNQDPQGSDHVSESESPEEVLEEVQEDSQEHNWREARRTMAEQKRRIDELEYRESVRVPVKEEPPEEPIEDDDFVRGQHLNRSLGTIQAKLHEMETKEAMARVRSKFSDFDDVVSDENVEWLKQNKPYFAKSIASLQGSPYEMALAAYEILNNSGVGSKVAAKKVSQDNRKKISENLQKPGSINVAKKQGGSSLSEANRFANGLTPDLKKALWAEMIEAKKGLR